MKPLALCVATIDWPGWEEGPGTWNPLADSGPYEMYIARAGNTVRSYQEAMNKSTEPILGFIHDDLHMYEQGWDTRILREFDDPQVAVLGVAGATGHCVDGIYNGPFNWHNMFRCGFRSNLRDAEGHGLRFTGSCNVAVLDGMAIFVRRDWLLSIGSWAPGWIYDYWICCECLRAKRKIRLVGLDCFHKGGQSHAWAREKGLDTYSTYPEQHMEALHRMIYDEYRDVLPSRVEP